MLKNLRDPREAREVMLSLLPTSGTLAGIAVGLVGVINARPSGGAATWADEILLLASLGFLLACYLIFFAMRRLHRNDGTRLWKAIDIVFLLSMTLMVFSGFVVVFEFM